MLVHIKNEDRDDIRGTFSLKSLTNYDMKLYEAVCVLTSKEQPLSALNRNRLA